MAEDYGVAGFAMICVTFMKTFSGFGISSAAVHADEFDHRGVATAFTLRQLIGIVAFLVTITLSEVAGTVMGNNAIPPVIRVLAFAILIDNFSMVSSVLLARKLRFSVISVAETALVVASSVTAMILVQHGFKYWSIAYAFLAANFVFLLVTYISMPYRFSFSLDLRLAKEYLRFGCPVFMTGLLSFTILNVDNAIVGSVAGATQLGYYSIAYNWGAMVCSIMGAVIFGVLFPTFSRMQGNTERMKHAYFKVLRYTAFLSFLCNFGLFCVADNFLVFVLGKGTEKWLPSLLTLRILCFYGMIRSLMEPVSSLLMAGGDTRTPLKATLLVALLELSLVYPAARFGSIETVGGAVLAAYIAQSAIYLPALKKRHGVGAGEILECIVPAALAGGGMLAAFLVFDPLLEPGLPKLCTSIVYLTVCYLLFYGGLTRFSLYGEIRGMLFSGE